MFEPSPSLAVIREALRIIGRERRSFQHPKWLSSVAEHVPADEPRARRDSLRFLTILKAIALCQSFADGRRERNGPIEITPADYCVAWEILHEAFASTYRDVHPRALKVAQAVRSICTDQKKLLSVRELAQHLSWQPAVVYKWVKVAIEAKLMRYEDDPQPKNVKRLLPGPVSSSGFLPHPALVFAATDVIGQIQYTSPLTGKLVSLRRRYTDGAE